MTTDELDPLIHVPTRLKIVATLAALPDGDTLSVPRLQDMIRLPPGGLITCLRELAAPDTSGREPPAATEHRPPSPSPATAGPRWITCTAALRQLPEEARQDHQAPPPGMRAGDADREAAAAALGEHFAQGRLTLHELNARLDATLTATTHGELSQVTRDLPDLTVLSARVSLSRGKRARPGSGNVRGGGYALRSWPDLALRLRSSLSRRTKPA